MQTYYLLGKYTADSIREISTDRTRRAAEIVQQSGGEVVLMHALLGEFDLVIVARFPGNQQAARAAVAIARMTGISMNTCPALSVDDFDALASEVSKG